MADMYSELSKANIDYEFFLERYGTKESYERMLFGFLDDLTFDKMLGAYDGNNKKETVVYATSLLGTAQYLGFRNFCNLLKPVSEIYLVDDEDKWDEFIHSCKEEYDRICSCIRPFKK